MQRLDRGLAPVLELLARCREGCLVRLPLGRLVGGVALDELLSLHAQRALRLGGVRRAQGSLARELAFELGPRGLCGGDRSGPRLELALGGLELAREHALLALGGSELRGLGRAAGLDGGEPALERGAGGGSFGRERLGRRGVELAPRHVGAHSCDLLVAGDHLLAQVQELALAPPTGAGRALGGRARALELGRELAHLALEPVDPAQLATVGHAGLLGLRALRDLGKAEVECRRCARTR